MSGQKDGIGATPGLAILPQPLVTPGWRKRGSWWPTWGSAIMAAAAGPRRPMP